MKDSTKSKGARLSDSQLADVMHRAAELLDESSHLRTGQSFFIALEEMFPIVANEKRGTEIDPFYRADLLPELYEFLLTEPEEKLTKPKDKKAKGWQVCPVCNAYRSRDTCHVCSGAGIINIKTGRPPK